MERTKHKVGSTDVGNRAGVVPRGLRLVSSADPALLLLRQMSAVCETSYFNGGSEKSF